MEKPIVLFICIHNSARSQMAEAWVNHLYGDLFEAQSTGLEPGTLNPLAVRVMKEVGIDISRKETKSVFNFVQSGIFFSYVITVCDEASAEQCPIFPGVTKRFHWSIPDPSTVTGTPEEKLEKVRAIRDAVRSSVEQWRRQIRSEQKR